MARAHDRVLQIQLDLNTGYAPAYGLDPITQQAKAVIARELNVHPDNVAFCPTGTAANVIALSWAAQAQAYSTMAVLAAHCAHINTDEAAAPEVIGRFKIISLLSADGKIHVDDPALLRAVNDQGVARRAQPAIISLSQPTELGTLYSLAELQAIVAFAKKHGLLVHLDGARLCNAAAALGVGLAEMLVGVDVLSFGLTKNGAIDAEMVVCNSPERCHVDSFRKLVKSLMSQFSKNRYKAMQVLAMFQPNERGEALWWANASHANEMCALLQRRMLESRVISQADICQEAGANALLVRLDNALAEKLKQRFEFYQWESDETHSIWRWMTSWQTSEVDIDAFVEYAVSLFPPAPVSPEKPVDCNPEFLVVNC